MTTEPTTEPRTEAGRRFYFGNAVKGFESKLLRDILAIEAESFAAGRAAALGPDSIDVERLARALRVVRPWKGNPGAWSRVHAAAIAAEYATLAHPAEAEKGAGECDHPPVEEWDG